MTPREIRCRLCGALEPDGRMGYCAVCILDAFELGIWCAHHGIFSRQTYTAYGDTGMEYQQWAPPSHQRCPWCCASHGPLIADTCPTCEALEWVDLLLAISPLEQGKGTVL